MNDSEFTKLDHLPKVRKKLYAHRRFKPQNRGVRLDIPSAKRGIEVVTVHWNRNGGKVIGYDHSAVIEDAEFIVSETGARHVKDGGSKYPFAFIGGDLVWTAAKPDGVELYYNPREVEEFVEKSSRRPVIYADRVNLIGKRIYAIGLVYKPRGYS